MKWLLKITALICALAIGLSLVACDGNNEGDGDDKKDPAAQSEKQGNKVGDICYTFDIELLLEDGTVNIKDLRGKVVILNFWGTWCNPCMKELPHFDDVASEYADEVAVVAIHSSKSGDADPVDYVNEKFAGSKIIFAKDVSMTNTVDKYFSLYGGKNAYPYTLVLDTKGVITYADEGALSYDDLVLLIDSAKD